MAGRWGFEGMPAALGGDGGGHADSELQELAHGAIEAVVDDVWLVRIVAPALPEDVPPLGPGLLGLLGFGARSLHHREPSERYGLLCLTADDRLVLVGLDGTAPDLMTTTVLTDDRLQSAHVGNPLSVGGYVVAFVDP